MWNKVYDSEYLLHIFDILSMFVNTTSFTFSTPNDYIYGNWVGNNATLDENCTNPKGLYESIISKPENLYWSISYRYFDGTISTEYASNTSSEIRSHIDTIFYGRCFTFNPTTEMIRLGIQMVEFQFLKQCTIYVHTKRLFQMVKDITEIIVPKNSMIKMDIDYEVYNMLDFGGQPCNAEPEFDKDFCTQDAFEKKALEKYGCTSPFGPNKDKICTDQNTGSKVMEFYRQIFRNLSNNCLSPCSFVSTKGIKIMEQKKNYGYVWMVFKENIKVIEAHHLYSTLSLIAEIGGYVGLFLGVSVNQVSTLMNDLIDKIDGGFNRL